jgi:hypothetical protein
MTGEIRFNAHMARMDDFHRQAAERRLAGAGDHRRAPRASRVGALISHRRRRGATARTATVA